MVAGDETSSSSANLKQILLRYREFSAVNFGMDILLRHNASFARSSSRIRDPKGARPPLRRKRTAANNFVPCRPQRTKAFDTGKNHGLR